MDSLMKDRTVFVIAHRLSTVRNSKAIMVLDHGEIIERGNHDELINQKEDIINCILENGVVIEDINRCPFCIDKV